MHGTHVRDLQETLTLRGIEGAFKLDHALDAIELSMLGLAVRAIRGVDLGMAQADADALQRPGFAISIEPERHRRAGTERHQQEFVRPGPTVVAARGHRLVGREPMSAIEQMLGELAVPAFHHFDPARLDTKPGLVGCGSTH